MTATSGNFKGAINSGSTITGSEISGGSINITKGSYYLRMGQSTSNPEVSGLNVGSQGINSSSLITTSSHISASYYAIPGYDGTTKLTVPMISGMNIASDGTLTRVYRRIMDVRGGIVTYVSDSQIYWPT